MFAWPVAIIPHEKEEMDQKRVDSLSGPLAKLAEMVTQTLESYALLKMWVVVFEVSFVPAAKMPNNYFFRLNLRTQVVYFEYSQRQVWKKRWKVLGSNPSISESTNSVSGPDNRAFTATGIEYSCWAHVVAL